MSLTLDEEEAINEMLNFGLSVDEIVEHTSIDRKKVRAFIRKSKEESNDRNRG